MADVTDSLYRSVLVLRCQAGDHAAFEELVAQFQPRLRYFLLKMVRDSNRVDDLLQDVWLDVFRQVPRLADRDAFPAWLFQIARHRAFRELRRRGQVPCSLDGVGEPAAEELDEEFTAEDAERVHAALDQLAPEHREVLLLRFLEEMSYEEMARVTGCQLGTVGSRLHYAKRALRRVIEEVSRHE
jgi:RNA polymerase sigma-70 factor (ECF subfamily)